MLNTVKIEDRILTNWILKGIIIDRDQCGFMNRKSPANAIHGLKIIIEKLA